VAQRRHDGVGGVPAALGGDFERDRGGPGEERGIPGVARVPAAVGDSVDAGVRDRLAVALDAHYVGAGPLDGPEFRRLDVCRDVDLGVDPRAGGVGGDCRTGVARGVLEHPVDAQRVGQREHHRRAAILEAPGREQRLQFERRVPVRRVDQRRPPFAERHAAVDRQRRVERPEPAVAVEMGRRLRTIALVAVERE
jgi:hypothetical protein